MNYDKESGVDWEQYYPPDGFERKAPIEVQVGGVYAYVTYKFGGAKGVLRCTENGSPDREVHGKLLARGEDVNRDKDRYPVSLNYIVAVIQEPGGRLRSPRDVYGTGAAASAQQGRRQVSHNGRDWVNYDTLEDSDAFETYEHQRTVMPGGKTIASAPALKKTFACAASCTAVVARAGEYCLRHYVEREKTFAIEMKKADDARAEEAPPPAALAHSSHATSFGGIWSLR